MADSTALTPRTFANLVSIVENRAKIAGAVQDRDRNSIKGFLNEWNEKITNERAWQWRKFDRAFTIDRAITTGTVAATLDSRSVVFTGLTLSNVHFGRTLRINNTDELYRIIGLTIATNTAYLDVPYAGTTALLATYRMFHYEFPLPPDLDSLDQVYVDSPYSSLQNKYPDLEPVNVMEFNRMLAASSSDEGQPLYYCQDGKISNEAFPALDVMVMDYDFLAGEIYTNVDRIRVFPIQPDRRRIIHLNYTISTEGMAADDDEPLMPKDNRWVLVHFALFEWHKRNGSGTMADREYATGKAMLKEMRSEYRKTETKPKFIVDGARYARQRNLYDYKELHRMSRIGEST